jgi:hypothetical protein
MKQTLIVAALAIFTLSACSSSGPKKLNVERNYTVKDQKPDPAPEWVDSLGSYRDDHKDFTYYLGESGAVSDRTAGCEEAKMRANAKIAGEVSTYIENKVASFQGGQLHVDENAPTNPGQASHFAQLLKSKTMAMLHSVREDGTFWQKKQNNDNKNFFYECSVLQRISNTDLATLVRNASNAAPTLVENPEAKKEVMNALHDVKDFQPSNK